MMPSSRCNLRTWLIIHWIFISCTNNWLIKFDANNPYEWSCLLPWWHEGRKEQNLEVVFYGCTWSICCSWGVVKYTLFLHAHKQQFDNIGLVTMSSVGEEAWCLFIFPRIFFCLENEYFLFFCARNQVFLESTNRF